jgi:hypothetical protein
MYVKTERRWPMGGIAKFILEEPTVLELGQDIVFRGVPYRIVSFFYNIETKLTDDCFYAIPHDYRHSVPKYSRYTKVKIYKPKQH